MGTAPVKQIKSESSYMRRLAFFLALARANLPQSLRGTEERVQKEEREGDLRIEGFKDGEGEAVAPDMCAFARAFTSDEASLSRRSAAKTEATATQPRANPQPAAHYPQQSLWCAGRGWFTIHA